MTSARALVVAVALVGACAGPPAVGTLGQAIAVTPFEHDFGSWMIGDTAPARQFIVSPVGVEYDVITGITEACDDFDVDLSLLDNPAEVFRECEPGGNPAQLMPPCINNTQRFNVTFHPAFAGPQGCTITIAMQSGTDLLVSVTGTGLAPPVALTLVTPIAAALDFGAVVVGADSAMIPITIRSDGATALDLDSFTLGGPDAADFSFTTVDTEPLAQGATFTWQVVCKPSVTGPRSATFTIVSNAPAVAIALACSGIQSDLAVASPVQFDPTLIGMDRPKTVSLTNTGTADLTIASAVITAGPFTAPSLTAVLGPGGTANLEVTFTPSAADVDTDVRGTLVITWNAGADSRTIDLIGPARDAALSLIPGGALEFGTVCGGESRAQPIVALNSGSGAVDVISAAVTGPGFSLAAPTLPATLPPRGTGTATFTITATPSGDATGELTLTTEIPGRAPTVVPVHAVGLATGVGASPLAIDFGGVVVNELSGIRTGYLTNCDGTELAVTAVTLTGADAAEFALGEIKPTAPPTTIAPRGRLQIDLALRPTAAGDKTATLTIVHSAGTTTIPLTGLGVGAEPDAGARGSYYACSTGAGATGGGLAPIGVALALLLLRRRRARRA